MTEYGWAGHAPELASICDFQRTTVNDGKIFTTLGRLMCADLNGGEDYIAPIIDEDGYYLTHVSEAKTWNGRWVADGVRETYIYSMPQVEKRYLHTRDDDILSMCEIAINDFHNMLTRGEDVMSFNHPHIKIRKL